MKLPAGETGTVDGIVRRLRELIAALDRRTPRPERTSERQIVADADALRKEAVERLAQLESGGSEC